MDTLRPPGIEPSQVDYVTLQKMAFVYNALQSGWAVRKRGPSYVFTKKHAGEKEVMLESYLKKFVSEGLNMDALAST